MTFLAGEEATATRLNNELGVTVVGFGSASGTVTSSSYVTSRTGATGEAEALFTPSASGKVLVHWSCKIDHTVNNAFSIVSYRIRTGASIGSGTQVAEGGDNISWQHRGDIGSQMAGQTALVTGLAFITHNIQLIYRTSSATMTALAPYVIVHPVT